MQLKRITLFFRLQKGNKKIIFRNLSVQLPQRGLVVITGESGVGKSSLLSLINGTLIPQRGKIISHGNSRLKPIYLEDQAPLIDSWKTKDYVLPEQKDLLNQLGLTPHDYLKRYQVLSGGQKSRLQVALFLSQPASVYLLDEPTHALDVFHRQKLVDAIVNHAQSNLVIVATHDSLLVDSAIGELNLSQSNQYTWRLRSHVLASTQKRSPQFKGKLQSFWLNKLITLHRGGLIGMMSMVAFQLLHLSLITLMAIQIGFIQQKTMYEQRLQTENFVLISEKSVTSIHDSPFQLVRQVSPDLEALNRTISMFEGAIALPYLGHWLPKEMTIQNVPYQVGWIDAPYNKDYLSVYWIHPPIHLPSTLTIVTKHTSINDPFLKIDQPIHLLGARRIQSWFEPAQILLSYWQWLSFFQTKLVPDQEHGTRYLDWYQEAMPPQQAMLYDQHHRIRQFLQTNQEFHAWSLTPLFAETYDSLSTFLPISMAVLYGFLFSLLMMMLFVWWTRLHWIYQQQRRQVIWLLRLGISFGKVWKQLTLKTVLIWCAIQGFVFLVWYLVMSHQLWIPGWSWSYAMWVFFLEIGLFFLTSLLLRMYRHA